MAKRNHEITLKDALGNFSNQVRLKDSLMQNKLVQIWKDLYGDYIHSLTEHVKLKDNVMYVKFTSSVLKNEMHLNKTKVLSSINEKIRPQILTDIIFR